MEETGYLGGSVMWGQTQPSGGGMLWEGEVISPTFRHAYSIERGCAERTAAWLVVTPG